MPISARPVADDLATRYALDVIDGKIVAGACVRAACARHLKDLEIGSARGLMFNVDKAKHACGFFPSVLTVTEGIKEGQPFDLLQWHGFVAASLHGWFREDGLRRYRMAWMETGKGQAKSPFMAGMGLYMMGFAGKQRSEVYAIASDKDQANVLFKDAVGMSRATIPDCDDGDSLEARGTVVIRGTGDNAWKIEHPDTSSKFQSMASVDSISGPRPYAVLADEIHEFKSAYALQIWKAAIDKMSGDPLMILGTNTPASNQIVGTEYSDLFQRIATGAAEDDSLFSFIARVDKEDIETVFDNEAVWQKALPALDVTFPIDNVRKRVQTAKLLLSEALATKRLYFGIPVGSDGFWISEEAWNSCLGAVDPDQLKGCRCWLSLDLSKKNDLTAVTATWVDAKGHLWSKTWYFTTKAGLADRARDDNAPYEDWAADPVRSGMTALDGAVIDYAFVARQVKRLVEAHKVEFMAVDPAKIDDFTAACALEDVGLPVWQFQGPDEPAGEGLKLVRHGQGPRIVFQERSLSMPRSVERLEDRILNGTITIDKSPVTTMCAANVMIRSDEMNNRAFDKKRSRGRIDGVVTIAMGVGAADNELPEAKKPAKYRVRVL